MAGLAAEPAAVDDDAARAAQLRLDLGEGAVEVLLGEGQRARDPAHAPEVPGPRVEEERPPVEERLGVRRLDELVARLHEDAAAEGEAPAARGVPREPGGGARNQYQDESLPVDSHIAKVARTVPMHQEMHGGAVLT